MLGKSTLGAVVGNLRGMEGYQLGVTVWFLVGTMCAVLGLVYAKEVGAGPHHSFLKWHGIWLKVSYVCSFFKGGFTMREVE